MNKYNLNILTDAMETVLKLTSWCVLAHQDALFLELLCNWNKILAGLFVNIIYYVYIS